MGDRIKCFFIKFCVTIPPETEGNGATGLPVYEAPDGNWCHLGEADVTLPSGNVIPPAPVGAMWDCDWMRDHKMDSGLAYNRNPDGVVLAVRTPGGDWVVDGPSFCNRVESGSWSRTGTIPNVTATPSIDIPGKYHGWLRDGYLVEC